METNILTPTLTQTPLPPPTFVLVPGHWHTTTHLQPLLASLASLQQPTKATQLHSVGLKPNRPTFSDDVSVIYNAVSSLLVSGKDVVLMLHSFAGMPGAEAVNRLIADGGLERGNGHGRLRRVVFVAAYTFPAGVALDAKDFIRAEDPNFSIDQHGMAIMSNTWHTFFNDTTLSTAKTYVDAIAPTYYLASTPVITSDTWKSAPCTALLCKRDNAIPPKRQEEIWQGHEVEWIDSGHSPYVSKPGEVAEILVRLANRVEGVGVGNIEGWVK